MAIEFSGQTRASIEQIAEVLRDHDRFIITTHVNPDGDAIGSCLALQGMLEQLGKQAWIINPEATPQKFKFLDPGESILVYEAATCDPLIAAAEVHCTLDVSEPKRLGAVAEPVGASKLVKVLIDHHPDNNHPASLALIDPEAAATGILLYDLAEALGIDLTPEVAGFLYVAIMTDTGSFRFPNTDSKTHRVVARLLEAGADPAALYSQVYEQDTLPRFRLFQKVILTAQFASNNQLVWMICPRGFFEQTGTTNADLEDFVNALRSLREVEIAILFSEPQPGQVRVSMRSKSRVAVNQLAARFGGGGHERAAGAVLEMSLEEAQAQVIAAAKETLAETEA